VKLVFYATKYRKMIDGVGRDFPDIEVVSIKEPKDVAAAVAGADIFITTNSAYTPEVAEIVREKGTALRWMHFTNSGIDYALESGVPPMVAVTNSSAGRARAVATHAMTLLLALVRRLPDCAAAAQRHEWPRTEMNRDVDTLDKKTMALIGLGAIGQDIARKAKAFDMRVIGISGIAEAAHVDELRPRERLHETLAEADVVMLATAYDPSTHHIIDAKALAAMKPSALIVNIARGPMIEEAALIAALKAGQIRGAGLDVTEIEPPPADSPLWDAPNLVLTPHSAGGGGDDAVLFDILSEHLRLFRARKPFARVLSGPTLPA
jgi:phosphoglycerate dehydrogenase-like enzyme